MARSNGSNGIHDIDSITSGICCNKLRTLLEENCNPAAKAVVVDMDLIDITCKYLDEYSRQSASSFSDDSDDHLRLIILVDSMCQNYPIDDSTSYELWKIYLQILKANHQSISSSSANKIAEVLQSRVFELLSKLETHIENPKIIESILRLLFFYCQRLSATIAYLSHLLSQDTMYKCYCGLSFMRGCYLYPGLSGLSDTIYPFSMKCTELYVKSLRNPSHIPKSANITHEKTLSCQPCTVSNYRFIYRKMLFDKIFYSGTSFDSDSKLGLIDPHRFHPVTILGFLHFSIHDLEQTVRDFTSASESNSNHGIIRNDINILSRDSSHQETVSFIYNKIEEICHFISLLNILYCGFVEDQFLLDIVQSVVESLFSLCQQEQGQHINLVSDLWARILALCISPTPTPSPSTTTTTPQQPDQRPHQLWACFVLLGILSRCDDPCQTTLLQGFLDLLDCQLVAPAPSPSRPPLFSVTGLGDLIRRTLLIVAPAVTSHFLSELLRTIRAYESNDGRVEGDRDGSGAASTGVSYIPSMWSQHLIEGICSRLPLSEQRIPSEDIEDACGEYLRFAIEGVTNHFFDQSITNNDNYSVAVAGGAKGYPRHDNIGIALSILSCFAQSQSTATAATGVTAPPNSHSKTRLTVDPDIPRTLWTQLESATRFIEVVSSMLKSQTPGSTLNPTSTSVRSSRKRKYSCITKSTIVKIFDFTLSLPHILKAIFYVQYLCRSSSNNNLAQTSQNSSISSDSRDNNSCLSKCLSFIHSVSELITFLRNPSSPMPARSDIYNILCDYESPISRTLCWALLSAFKTYPHQLTQKEMMVAKKIFHNIADTRKVASEDWRGWCALLNCLVGVGDVVRMNPPLRPLIQTLVPTQVLPLVKGRAQGFTVSLQDPAVVKLDLQQDLAVSLTQWQRHYGEGYDKSLEQENMLCSRHPLLVNVALIENDFKSYLWLRDKLNESLDDGIVRKGEINATTRAPSTDVSNIRFDDLLPIDVSQTFFKVIVKGDGVVIVTLDRTNSNHHTSPNGKQMRFYIILRSDARDDFLSVSQWMC